jgi:hypothetical protein
MLASIGPLADILFWIETGAATSLMLPRPADRQEKAVSPSRPQRDEEDSLERLAFRASRTPKPPFRFRPTPDFVEDHIQGWEAHPGIRTAHPACKTWPSLALRLWGYSYQLLHLPLQRLDLGVAEAEMVRDLVHEHVPNQSIQILAGLDPLEQDSFAV